MSRRLQRVAGSLLALLCLGWVPPGHLLAAQSGGDTLQPYEPAASVSGEIRIWGSPADAALLRNWSADFSRFQPEARIQATLYGQESTLAGVYCGVADLAFIAREMRLPVENMAFTWVYRYPPFSVEIANAGLTAGRPSANLAVVVNAANPLQHLTLVQLDGILGAERRRGGANLRKWGDLGLGGIWKGRPIHVYGPPVDSIDGIFMRTVVLRGDDAQVLQAVAQDAQGIAYASLDLPSQHIKSLALSATAGAPFYALSERNVGARAYPLSRAISMVLNREPGKPIELKVKEFLRFILSRDGQAALARDGHYIPLTAASERAQLERLE
jgi:phosphate transport system substrate-binding protein